MVTHTMLSKIRLLYHTVKNLKLKQVIYRLYYGVRDYNRVFQRLTRTHAEKINSNPLQLIKPVPRPVFFYPPATFSFLNRSHRFNPSIDWNFSENGKLWTYHLNYFDYLLQPETDKHTGLSLIRDFIRNQRTVQDGLEPYPVSLRCMNWIKFLSLNEIRDREIDHSLFAQCRLLLKFPEYHLLGNHLLENGFGLLFGGRYFNNSAMLKEAQFILTRELKEQILEDGAHFERSPMYHVILLESVLDGVNVIRNNEADLHDLEHLLSDKARKMLCWLNQIQFTNGDLPAVNDTVRDQIPDLQSIRDYAQRLEIEPEKIKMGESGYRMVQTGDWELFMDAGNIGPDYLPAHAHSDTLSFILHHQGQPVIEDPGVSTYEGNARRQWERSTEAHNTVQPGRYEQSEIWGAFRVGRRAHARILEESDQHLVATHDGYKKLGLNHQRTWQWRSKGIEIQDNVEGTSKEPLKAYFHFHPDVKVSQNNNKVTAGPAQLSFENHTHIELEDYKFCNGFNSLIPAKKAVVYFNQTLHTKISSISS